ncbi:MAG: hypothetical protein JW864_04775 [Spirochaetes bacterium]|nr:hypothetical protein [Spirochaetota bacterium]
MFYNLLIFTGVAVAKIISLFDEKMRKFFSLRKGEISRVADYFKKRERNEKVIWFHSASAGEFEQIKPVIDFLKETGRRILIVCSFFSPSGYEAGIKYDNADFCFNLPVDTKRNMRKLLDSINPYLIINTKYDIWRNLTIESFRKGIKTVLINGTLPEKSFRHRFPASLFFGPVYSRLFKIYAISGSDAERFNQMICRSDSGNIIISGDTRFDRVKTVIKKADLGRRIISKDNGSLYLVAGSTYEVSEKKLLTALNKLNREKVHVRLILVPHEINSTNMKRAGYLISSYGYKPKFFSQIQTPVSVNEDEVLVVNAYGILALLYHEADVVFIGGSFKGSVHSVLEPAVFGKPVICGPYIGNAYEAFGLKDAGGLILCDKKEDLAGKMLPILCDKEYRQNISKKISRFYNKNSGATEFLLKDMENFFEIFRK